MIFGGCPQPYKQNGTGLSFRPKNYLADLIDLELKCPDSEAFSMCRKIAKNEGVLLGGSSGSVLWSAQQLLQKRQVKPNSTIVCLLPDSGMKYIETIYSEG